MTGLVCLQGGHEFSAGCRDMDAAVLAQAQGPVVVTALAGEIGRDYRTATDNGVGHLRSLTAHEVLAAPDAREHPEAALELLRRAATVVLPGGSPSRLLEALRKTGVAALLAELLDAGGTLVGSSAGAMVVCGWTVLPDRGRLLVAPGLGLLPRLLVVPHWTGSGRPDWLAEIEATVPADVQVLGLAEQSGVLVRDDDLVAVGASPAELITARRQLPPGTRWRMS